MTNRTTNHTQAAPTTPSHRDPSCPTWCIQNHETEPNWHHGAFFNLAETEDGSDHYYAHLNANPGKPARIIIARGDDDWDLALSLADFNELADALDDGTWSALETLHRLVKVAEAPERWWQRADNPPCPDWCSSQHPADEFASGVLTHYGDSVTVGDVMATRSRCITPGDDPGVFETAYDRVEVDVDADGMVIGNGTGDLPDLAEVLPVAQAIVELAGGVAS